MRSLAVLAFPLLLAASPAAAGTSVGVGELSCGGRISAAVCGELTAALVAELAKDSRLEVVRQADIRKEQARCGDDPACARKARRELAKLVAGTVMPQAKGGYLIRIRWLDARKMAKEAEAATTVAGEEQRALAEGVATAARSLIASIPEPSR